MVILGALFTFLAIAYSTTRAATQGSSIGTGQGQVRLDTEQGEDHSLITNEPSERRRMRQEALQAAVDAGYPLFLGILMIDLFRPRHSKMRTMRTARRGGPEIPQIEMTNEDPFNIDTLHFTSCSSWQHVIQRVY